MGRTDFFGFFSGRAGYSLLFCHWLINYTMMISMDVNLEQKVWYSYVEEDLIELIKQSLHLVKTVKHWDQKFHDYSFVVFPAAKAYEGFLKKLFLDMGFINKQLYYYKYFRIGKALNPELERKFRKAESIYDKIVEYCGGTELADQLWLTWKKSRNSLFHWFPDERTAISLVEAEENIALVLGSIDRAFEACKIEVPDVNPTKSA